MAQLINYQGRVKAVVLSIANYRKLLKPKNTLVKFFQQSPLVGVSLDLDRDQDTGREINISSTDFIYGTKLGKFNRRFYYPKNGNAPD